MYLRGFLDGDTPFDVDLPDGAGTDGPINVARYLTGNRNQGGPGAFLGTVDGGEALGDMLNDASNPRNASAAEPVPTDFPDDPDQKKFKAAHDIWERDPRARPTIAANTMAGYQDGLDRDNSGGWGSGVEDKTKQGEDIYGNHNSRLRSWMGSIISPYAADLAEQMHNNSSPGMQAGSRVDDNHAAHMRFSRDMVDRFKGPGGLLQDLALLLREDARVRGELEARQSWTVGAARLGLAAPWVVLLLLSGGGASASVWNSPGGIAVLCSGAGICVIAYLIMKAMGRLSTDPRNLGGAR